VGIDGTVLATADGGDTWTSRPTGTDWDLAGITCPTSNVCLAVGHGGTILATADGGISWAGRSSATSPWMRSLKCPDGSSCLTAIACPTVSHCLAVGINGTVLVGSLASAVTPRANPRVGMANGKAAGGTSLLLAAPCPRTPGGAAIKHWNFTGYYDGSWHLLCQVTAPSKGDECMCTWTLTGEKPPSTVTISLDIFDAVAS
jgi:hypothetical protein